jgi:PAS domain S-box
MLFGGNNGFNMFNPDRVIDNPIVPTVVLTNFKIFNKDVPIGEHGSPLQQQIGISDSLEFSYENTVFTFEFSALNFLLPEKNQYAYRMEGFEKEWNYVGTKHTATYTNLDPGEYVFRVKASNNDGLWNEKGTVIRITIAPPYWQTSWFRLILLAVFLGIIYWIYQWRIQARDFIAQKRLDAALAKERNLLRLVIDNIPDGIYTKDLNCRKTLANRADVHNMGLQSENEVLGKDDFELYPKELVEGFYADDQKVIQTGQPVIDREEYVIDEKGQKIWLSTTKLPLRDENNQIIGLVGIGRNITEKKKAEEERKKAEAEREKLITQLQEALADVKLLSGLVPICANCKKIRDDQGYWTQIESYIQDRSDAKFSHSICPDCAQKLYPQYMAKIKEKENPPKNEI